MRSRIEAAEMSFRRRVAGLSLRHRVRSSDIRRELGVEPLLLRLGISQEELESVAGGKEVWEPLLSRLPPRPGPG